MDIFRSPPVLVDVSSATYGGKNQHPINRNHSDIVKFLGQIFGHLGFGYKITMSQVGLWLDYKDIWSYFFGCETHNWG